MRRVVALGPCLDRHSVHSEANVVITGAIKGQIDQIWNAFWSGGISNPLEVIEQGQRNKKADRAADLPGREGCEEASLRRLSLVGD